MGTAVRQSRGFPAPGGHPDPDTAGDYKAKIHQAKFPQGVIPEWALPEIAGINFGRRCRRCAEILCVFQAMPAKYAGIQAARSGGEHSGLTPQKNTKPPAVLHRGWGLTADSDFPMDSTCTFFGMCLGFAGEGMLAAASN